jgi:hypothetical protein
MTSQVRNRALLIAAAVGLAAVGVYSWSQRKPDFTAAQHLRINEGMTLQQVEAILGCPPGDYTRAGVPPSHSDSILSTEETREEAWLGETGSIHVTFDKDGRVALSSYSETHKSREDWVDWMLEKLKPW